MKFILFCEGWTEDKALPDFLRRWLHTQFSIRIGVKTVRFNGWQQNVVRGKCPYFKRLSDDLVELARGKGLT